MKARNDLIEEQYGIIIEVEKSSRPATDIGISIESGTSDYLSAVFAFASILSWCYYSRVCLQYLALPGGETVYSLCSVVCAFFGAQLPMGSLLTLADILGGLMIFPNLFLLFKLRGEVR